jgi:hypothetical protein
MFLAVFFHNFEKLQLPSPINGSRYVRQEKMLLMPAVQAFCPTVASLRSKSYLV